MNDALDGSTCPSVLSSSTPHCSHSLSGSEPSEQLGEHCGLSNPQSPVKKSRWITLSLRYCPRYPSRSISIILHAGANAGEIFACKTGATCQTATKNNHVGAV